MKIRIGLPLALLLAFATFSAFSNQTGRYWYGESANGVLEVHTAVPAHPDLYLHAGCSILTPGYSFVNTPGECESYDSMDGMCLFQVSNTMPKVLSIKGPSGSPDVKCCLRGDVLLSCQHLTAGPLPEVPTQYIYIASSGNGGGTDFIEVCSLTDNGATPTGCSQFTGTGGNGFDSPQGISFNPAGTVIYVTNLAGGPNVATVTSCAANTTTGVLTSCVVVNTSVSDSGHSIEGNLAIGANSRAYVPDYDNNQVLVYSLNVDGSLHNGGGSPTTVGITLAGNPVPPNSITILNGNAYIAATSANKVAVCPVTATSLGACTDAGPTFTGPLSVSFNNAGTTAYIANSNSTVSTCTVSGLTFTNCSVVTANTFNFGLGGSAVSNIFMPSITGYGYIPNSGTVNQLSICPLAKSGAVGTCNQVSIPNVITPTAAAVNPLQ